MKRTDGNSAQSVALQPISDGVWDMLVTLDDGKVERVRVEAKLPPDVTTLMDHSKSLLQRVSGFYRHDR